MGTWWNPKTSRSEVLTNCWALLTLGLFILFMVFRPEGLFGSPDKYWFFGALIGYAINAVFAALWLSTLFLFLWMFFSLGDGEKLGLVEWWLITGIALGVLLPVLTNKYHPDQTLLWFVIGTCLGWYGPFALGVWFISYLIS